MSVLANSTSTPATVFDEQVEAYRDDEARDYSGWYCIRTDPWPCPAPGCDVVVEFLTAAHLIVVWPNHDDPQMLAFANDAKRLGRNPKIVEYEQGYGVAVPYDVWVRIGRPIHGRYDRPSDVPFRKL